ncbi:MAG TPA: GNAT family N-acetyltransferase [Rhizomicrobium sp.]|nr:GNAT family N-acetyltransferase [Rhizomicrobium sp.]
MIDNKQESRFEREENGLRVWATYRVRDGQYQLPHVEADPPLRGTGAAGRLMQEIVEHARARQLVIVPRCPYARAWFARHPEAQDVLD